ncbi:MAG: phage minor head protein [Sulfurimicrobium sp.]|nr:phage minor head protein [Sulfurimicrobium sp.]
MNSPQLLAQLSVLPPEEAVKYMQQRGLLTQTFDWRDLWHEEHATQFTVSRLARLDLMQAIYDGITLSVKGELGRRDFLRGIKDMLITEGWWGEKSVIDPKTGELVTTKFDANRLKLIYDVNTRQAYAAGQWQRIERNQATSPYIRYITKRDERVRASHRGWDNLTLPVDHPFWHAHTPPNGWRCRCRITTLSQEEYDQGLSPTGQALVKEAPAEEWVNWENKRSGEVMQTPKGVDPGFAYNPGKAGAREAALNQAVQDKLDRAENLNGASPRALWNRVVSELAPSEIMKMKNLDPALLDNIGAVKGAEYYISQIRPAILHEIAQGGLPGSAALKHEIAEVAALRLAGLNIYENSDIEKIVAAFGAAEKTFDPAAHIPWHLAALKAELEYVRDTLKGKVLISLGEAARIAYPGMSEAAELKMFFELSALGEKMPDLLREEVANALQN